MKNLKNTLTLFTLLSIGTVSSLNAQCLHTPRCVFDSCYYGGDGTETEPYQIWSKEHLQELADSVNNATTNTRHNNWSRYKYFVLMQDIIDTVRTMMIGGTPSNHNIGCFQGNFNGQNFKIVLGIDNKDGTRYTALFRGISNNSIISNLTTEGYVITDNHIVAGVVANTVTGGTTIINVTNNCDVSGEIQVGGIIANGLSTLVSNCTNNGKIFSSGFYAGGISGISEYTINSVNNGEIIASATAGGITGANGSHVINCINNGKIYSDSTAGGIVGLDGRFGNNTIISNNINYGFVNSYYNAGGIVGLIYILSWETIVSNNSNFGVVIGEEDTGCIIGRDDSGMPPFFRLRAIISNNHYDKQMCGE